MNWTDCVMEYLQGNEALGGIVIIASITLVALVLGYLTKNAGAYVACLLLAFGGVRLFTDFFENGKRSLGRWLPYWCFLGGIGYVLLIVLSRVRDVLWKKKQQKREISRRLQYALPDKENAYVRARLGTALQAGAESASKMRELFITDKKSVGVRLGYARKMAVKIQEAPLTPVERLDVEELASLIGLYMQKEKWSNGDLRTVNEVFSKLLKLSAKYSIVI